MQEPSQEVTPLMRGILQYHADKRRYIIRGEWRGEPQVAAAAARTTTPNNSPQRFELLWLPAKEDDDDDDDTASLSLPIQSGMYQGSFSLNYIHITSTGKRKHRSKVIMDQNVQLKFTRAAAETDNDDKFYLTGRGRNQFGLFYLFGTAGGTNVRRHVRGEPFPRWRSMTSGGGPQATLLHVEYRRYYHGAIAPAVQNLVEQHALYRSSSVALTTLDDMDWQGCAIIHFCRNYWRRGILEKVWMLQQQHHITGVVAIRRLILDFANLQHDLRHVEPILRWAPLLAALYKSGIVSSWKDIPGDDDDNNDKA